MAAVLCFLLGPVSKIFIRLAQLPLPSDFCHCDKVPGRSTFKEKVSFSSCGPHCLRACGQAGHMTGHDREGQLAVWPQEESEKQEGLGFQ